MKNHSSAPSPALVSPALSSTMHTSSTLRTSAPSFLGLGTRSKHTEVELRQSVLQRSYCTGPLGRVTVETAFASHVHRHHQASQASKSLKLSSNWRWGQTPPQGECARTRHTPTMNVVNGQFSANCCQRRTGQCTRTWCCVGHIMKQHKGYTSFGPTDRRKKTFIDRKRCVGRTQVHTWRSPATSSNEDEHTEGMAQVIHSKPHFPQCSHCNSITLRKTLDETQVLKNVYVTANSVGGSFISSFY